MKAKIVKASELGTNCWLSLRFMGNCHRCQRFRACTYPEKSVSPRIQAKFDRMKQLQADLRRIQGEMAAISKELK